KWVAANTHLFDRVVGATQGIESIVEYGANIGLNLLALRHLLPDVELSAVEINPKAAEKLKSLGDIQVYCESILDFKPPKKWSLSFTKGVLIHINPDHLPVVYDLLYQSSNRYICIAEYFNPSPVAIPYRGHQDRLFKRDFAADLLDRFKDLRVVDYGFVWRRDAHFPQDDLTWFLFEKKN
ncbi:MAG: pseudaminic acid biosynthesis-associated methylase, partial [Spirochaetia bacterium]|nr:pseudaminic acid biosynthesis-associated methylase [Spirochaetia bacterium]